MSKIKIVIDAKNKPTNLPSPEAIIDQCPSLARDQFTATSIHGVRLALDKGSNDDAASVWVKFGWGITMGEARTQSLVAQVLDDNGDPAVLAPCVYLAFESLGIGYIVMEFIDGKTCDDSDAGLVAAAVESLIAIQGPKTPGPADGGLIEHCFFVEGRSSTWYETVQELEDHINSILRHERSIQRVTFSHEVDTHGLRLCASDMNRNNFMKDKEGRIVALNFGASCFLPPSFFVFALREGDDFTQLIANMVDYPKSTQLGAMLTASRALVPYGSNKIGEHVSLLSLLFLPLVPLQAD
ncbi:hypothetical protein IW262DRAFT_1276384 [Armillaria fumosa]|nr:hypothetical protein IW262DRAFT_1276384 [Armillaria fumosa]